jgi:hypothetical protein
MTNKTAKTQREQTPRQNVFTATVVLVSQLNSDAPKATLRSLAFNPKVEPTLPLE